MNEDQAALERFKGTARLFPLPNLVLFPHVLQGLHIFEPRYRQMTADALADDRLIAVVLLQAGWEKDYEGRPAIHPVACLGRIVTDQRLPDGRFNLQLRGLSRVRVVAEVETGKLYRSARVELLGDRGEPKAEARADWRRELTRAAEPWCPTQQPLAGAFRQLLGRNFPVGMLCDILSFTLPLPLEAKQALLAEPDVETRARELIRYLEAGRPDGAEDGRRFPPDFSAN